MTLSGTVERPGLLDVGLVAACREKEEATPRGDDTARHLVTVEGPDLPSQERGCRTGSMFPLSRVPPCRDEDTFAAGCASLVPLLSSCFSVFFAFCFFTDYFLN